MPTSSPTPLERAQRSLRDLRALNARFGRSLSDLERLEYAARDLWSAAGRDPAAFRATASDCWPYTMAAARELVATGELR